MHRMHRICGHFQRVVDSNFQNRMQIKIEWKCIKSPRIFMIDSTISEFSRFDELFQENHLRPSAFVQIQTTFYFIQSVQCA